MKRKVVFKFLKSSIFFVLTIFLSCNDDYLGKDIQMEKLDEIGKAFMDHLLASPNGEQQWKKLMHQGDLPPNEVALIFQGNSGWRYVLPLLKDNALEGMVIFPIEVGENDKYLSESIIENPVIIDKKEFKSTPFVQGVLRSSVSTKWQEKGIVVDEKLIVSQSDLTQFTPLSRGTGGVFPARYTLIAHNYLDYEGHAVISEMNKDRLEAVVHDVAGTLPGHLELELMFDDSDDVIYVITSHEEVAIYFYNQLVSYLQDRHHCEITFEFLWMTSSPGGTGGGMGGGMGGSSEGSPHSSGTELTEEKQVPDNIVVNLKTSSLSGQVEIGDVYYLMLDIYNTNPQGRIPNIENIEYFVRRSTTGQGGSLGETIDMVYTRKAISAGTFEFVAVIQIEGTTNKISSNTVTIKEMCPSISKFKDLPVVQNRAIELWNETVNYSRQHKSTHETCEFGCFVYLNTRTGEYHCGPTIPGEPVKLTGPVKGTVHFVYSPQNYDPRETFDLIVGTIHSHYPMIWAAPGLERDPGPSVDDKSAELPGIVYDYSQTVFAGDSVDMPNNLKKMYIYGPSRREIP